MLVAVLESSLCLLGPGSPFPQVCFIIEWPLHVQINSPAPHSAVSHGGLCLHQPRAGCVADPMQCCGTGLLRAHSTLSSLHKYLRVPGVRVSRREVSFKCEQEGSFFHLENLWCEEPWPLFYTSTVLLETHWNNEFDKCFLT